MDVSVPSLRIRTSLERNLSLTIKRHWIFFFSFTESVSADSRLTLGAQAVFVICVSLVLFSFLLGLRFKIISKTWHFLFVSTQVFCYVFIMISFSLISPVNLQYGVEVK